MAESYKELETITSDQERTTLHNAIWKAANELRGSIDGWDFKQYFLGMLFYRFLSESLIREVGKRENIDYRTLDDEKAKNARKIAVDITGFFIPPSELFCNVAANAEKDLDLNINLPRYLKNIEASAITGNNDSKAAVAGLFDDIDFNGSRLGGTVEERNAKLVKLLKTIDALNLGDFKDNNNDLFGDAYEYLMAMYAASAGKSGGEFFTPQEVSELLARITVVGQDEINKVYDPACGSGSLLLKYQKILGDLSGRPQHYSGQELNPTTYNLCRMNMFLHGLRYDQFSIARGDTLTVPRLDNQKPFDAIVSNPPYSVRWIGDEDNTLMTDPRFSPAGVLAPKSKADLAFVMHALSWLSEKGTAAIVSFPGVMYRGGAEQKIRKYLVEENYVEAVIQLPSDLFFGTSIATCILVLKKGRKDDNVLFVNAEKEFVRGSAKNKLTASNIETILKAFEGRKNIEHFARSVSSIEIVENDYNLSVSAYVTAEDIREVINITELNAEIKEIVAKQSKLRTQIDVIVAGLEGTAA